MTDSEKRMLEALKKHIGYRRPGGGYSIDGKPYSQIVANALIKAKLVEVKKWICTGKNQYPSQIRAIEKVKQQSNGLSVAVRKARGGPAPTSERGFA